MPALNNQFVVLKTLYRLPGGTVEKAGVETHEINSWITEALTRLSQKYADSLDFPYVQKTFTDIANIPTANPVDIQRWDISNHPEIIAESFWKPHRTRITHVSLTIPLPDQSAGLLDFIIKKSAEDLVWRPTPNMFGYATLIGTQIWTIAPDGITLDTTQPLNLTTPHVLAITEIQQNSKLQKDLINFMIKIYWERMGKTDVDPEDPQVKAMQDATDPAEQQMRT